MTGTGLSRATTGQTPRSAASVRPALARCVLFHSGLLSRADPLGPYVHCPAGLQWLPWHLLNLQQAVMPANPVRVIIC